jgi:hypothetical protein
VRLAEQLFDYCETACRPRATEASFSPIADGSPATLPIGVQRAETGDPLRAIDKQTARAEEVEDAEVGLRKVACRDGSVT